MQRYVEAWESRDVNAMVAILAEEVTFAMPPFPGWFHGRDALIAFITGTGTPALRHLVTRANGQPAIAWYLWDAQRESHIAVSLEVLALEGAHVREITAFALPELFPQFRLPAELN